MTSSRARAASLGLLVLVAPAMARAQARPKPRDPTPPAPTTVGVEIPTAPHVDEPISNAVPGGLTAEAAAKRAVTTSFSVKAAVETASGAAARTDVAGYGFVPSLTLTASYTHLSTLTPPVPGGGATRSVVTTAPAGTVDPPTVAVNDSGFNVLFNYYATQARLVVPVSDYLLKTKQEYNAAAQSEEAAHFDVASSKGNASFVVKQTYYEWLRARGAVAVADQTLAVAKAHSDEAKSKFSLGAVAAADVFRADAAASAAELLVERAKANETFFLVGLRQQIHAADEEKLEPGESLELAVAPVKEDLGALLKEAATSRPELQSLDRNAEAARKLASAARAGRYPTLNGVAQLDYSNPNERKFPVTAEFFPSWSVGAVLRWTPKDALVAGASAADHASRAAALDAQREAVRESITREVINALNAARTADIAVVTTTRQLDAEREAYRVSRQLYAAGRTTGTALLDAQRALEQVRFDNLNARADVRVARVQLEHAVGRDVRSAP